MAKTVPPINPKLTPFCLGLALFWLGLNSAGAKAEASAPPGSFDGARAYGQLLAQCAFGPRVPGCPAHEQARAYLKQELSRSAPKVEEQNFTVKSGSKNLLFTNLLAYFPASDKSAPWVLVCAHWDSRPTADRELDPARRAQPIPGANDGASGVAVVLELARLLAVYPPPQGVLLVLFDGEDYGPDAGQMFLGSRYFAKNYRGPKIAWGVLLDMIGDKDLEIPWEGFSRQSAPQVLARIWDIAAQLGEPAFVSRDGPFISDDHRPLLESGLPCVDLIDFNYPYWHTLEDTPDKCSPQSLQAVGRVVMQVLSKPPEKIGP
jgi:glutaminyl-peptide cyclotransferase